MIGGTGKKVLLQIVAKYADMWNAMGSADTLRGLIEVIQRHGDAVGRDTDAIEKTVMLSVCYKAAPARQESMCNRMATMSQISPEQARRQMLIGDQQECLDTIERYLGAGITHFILMPSTPYQLDEIQAFAEEVIPAATSRR